jgi:hypothetical protein
MSGTIATFQAYHQQVEAELQRRIATHQATIAAAPPIPSPLSPDDVTARVGTSG